MTRQQALALSFIRGFIADWGFSPSLREIAAGLGLKSTNRVHAIVHALRERGHITFEDNRARSIVAQWTYDEGYAAGWDACRAYMIAGGNDRPPGLPVAPQAAKAA